MKWNRIEFNNIPISRVKNHAAVCTTTGIFIFGGYDGTSHQSNLFKLDLKTRSFTYVKTQGELPCGRNGHTATLYKNEIFVIGGWNSNNPTTTKDIYKLNLDSFEWKKIHPTGDAMVPCNMHTANLYENQIFVFRGGDGTNYLHDLHCYDLKLNSWHLVHTTGIMPSARANHSSSVFKSFLFIFGGWNGCDRLRDLYRLDLNLMSWEMIDNKFNCPRPRAGMSLVPFGQGLLLFGGSGESSESYSDLWHFDTDANSWKQINFELCPSPRAGHTFTQLNCREFLLFGGSSGNSFAGENFLLDTCPRPDPPSSILAEELNFSGFFNNPEFSDLQMVVEGRVFYAHRVIITRRSEYFKQMLSLNMRECFEGKIEIKDVKFEIFKILMKYLYTGNAEIGAGTEGQELALGFILDVIIAADRFLLSPVVRNCELLLWNKLGKENALAVLEVIENIPLCRVKDLCYWLDQNED
jgi:N-acetylneuraminic acid mutarotase